MTDRQTKRAHRGGLRSRRGGRLPCPRPAGALLTLAVCALATWLLLAAPAQASLPPTHSFLAEESLTGLNHACGTAVDSQGDLYVASAGETPPKIYVFGPEHHQPGEQLAEITEGLAGKEPCGLAVDTNGNLYVSLKATGEVLRYQPTEYPFAGPPSYEPPETIDSSGEAQGIAVDPTDDRLYVAEGGHISSYTSQGVLGEDEVQKVQVRAESGTFTLSFGATAPTTTAPIAFNAPGSKTEGSGSVEAALEELGDIGEGDVSVTTEPEGTYGHSYFVTFQGALGSTNVEMLKGDPSGLTSGEKKIYISESAQGWAGHIGEGTLTEATGVAAYTYAGPKKERYVFAADSATNEVYAFGANAFAFAKSRELPLINTIDGSETPAGSFAFSPGGAYLGVDQASGHLFLYDQEHNAIDEFEATGEYFTQVSEEQLTEADPSFADAEPTALAVYPQWSEVQRVEVSAEGGTYRLCFPPAGEPGSECTAAIPPTGFGGNARNVQKALEALAAIGKGDVSVSGSGLSREYPPFTVRFIGKLADRNLPQMSCVDELSGAGHSCAVSTEGDGQGPGRLYVTSGFAAGAELLAFGPVASPGRASQPPPFSSPISFTKTCGAVIDSYGDVYAASGLGGKEIRVYGPDGQLIEIEGGEGHITDEAMPCGLAVDSEGNLYASEQGQVTRYKPSSYPPTEATTYTAEGTGIEGYVGYLPVAVNPADDHLLVTQEKAIKEYGSAAKGNPLLNPEIGVGLAGGEGTYGAGVDVCAKTGDVYAAGRGPSGGGAISVIEPPAGEGPGRLRSVIDGSGSPAGPYLNSLKTGIAVDQSDCHVLVREIGGEGGQRGAVEEYEPSGAFVGQFEPEGGFPTGELTDAYDIAVDNACAIHRNEAGEPEPLSEETTPTCAEFDSNDRNAYVPHLQSLYAFGPLSYGETPRAVTGLAKEVGGGEATLNGTVDPEGFEVEECEFEYLTQAEYEANQKAEEPPFEGAASEACAETPEEIGKGTKLVSVHAGLTGLDPAKRYYFRLLAKNEYGTSAGEAGRFGPPLIAAGPTARPIGYLEATIRATVDPSGLPTAFRVHFGTSAAYGRTAEPEASPLSAAAGPTALQILLLGLAEGTEYHYCLEVENEAAALPCEDRTFTTQERPAAESCPNAALRTGFSADLPDCRAYELTTPADTRGVEPGAPDDAGAKMAYWALTPSGPLAGQSLIFGTNQTLPGFEGSGFVDRYQTRRGEAGWTTSILTLPWAQTGQHPLANGFSADHAYAFIRTVEQPPGGLPRGTYLRTPEGIAAAPNCEALAGRLEWVGCGSLGAGPNVVPWFISPGGAHVVFSTETNPSGNPPYEAKQLEPDAPPDGTEAIYDRAPGGPTRVVSLLPGEETPAAGEDAAYRGSSEDGSAVAFEIGGTLYVRRNDTETIQAATGATFAGLSAGGGRVFYSTAAGLFACELEAGPCAGSGAHGPLAIAPAGSEYVNVSAEGSHVYFTSEEALTETSEENEKGEHAEAGKPNLYACDLGAGPCAGAGSHAPAFVAILDPEDLEGEVNLTRWVYGFQVDGGLLHGPGYDPSRTTPDGRFLVFQSRAKLTSYDNTPADPSDCGTFGGGGTFTSGPCTEIYRYDAEAGRLACVSCDPTNAPPTAEAALQQGYGGGLNPADTRMIVPNVTADGMQVVFETAAALVPEDANAAADVYEWQAAGVPGCERGRGCLRLISSGQGEKDSYLYSMTPDGHDVVFSTLDRLVGSDVIGTHSLYDARVGGGFPEAGEKTCEGDACQGAGSSPPALPAAGSESFQGAGNEPPRRPRCPKGKRRVHRHGKARCVKKRHHRRHHHKRRHGHRHGRASR